MATRIASFFWNVLRFIAWAALTLLCGGLGVWLPSLWQPYTGPADGFAMLGYGLTGVLVGGVASAAVVGWLTER